MEDFWKSDRFREWWDKYHWDALGEIECLSFKDDQPETQRTLRDYWQSEAECLIEFGGRKWTRVHLPPFDPDGNTCKEYDEVKSKQFWPLIKEKLAGAEIPQQPGKDDDPNEPSQRDEHQANFQGVVFPGWRINPEDGWLSGYWNDAIFVDWTFFYRAKFHNACFENATFLKQAGFLRCKVHKDLDFCGVLFLGNANFYHLEAFEWARFDKAEFYRRANFGHACFGQQANFSSCVFHDDVYFSNAVFCEYVYFGGAKFKGISDFQDAKFKAQAEFPNTEFEKRVSFQAPRTPEFVFANYTSFENAQFRGDAVFNGRTFCEATNFAGAKFHALPLFHGATLHPETYFEREGFLKWRADDDTAREWFAGREAEIAKERKDEDDSHPSRLSKFSISYWKRRSRLRREGNELRYQRSVYRFAFPLRLRWRHMTPLRRHMDKQTRRYELAFRTLRQLFADHQDIENEMMFHELEMDARRARTDVPILFERLFAWLYKCSSDYGRDMLRPVLWALGIWGATSAALFGGTRDMAAAPSFGTIGDFVLREFIPFLPTLQTNPAAWVTGAGAPGGLPMIVGMMNVLLPITAIGLTAVFLIALHRRFQIER